MNLFIIFIIIIYILNLWKRFWVASIDLQRRPDECVQFNGSAVHNRMIFSSYWSVFASSILINITIFRVDNHNRVYALLRCCRQWICRKSDMNLFRRSKTSWRRQSRCCCDRVFLRRRDSHCPNLQQRSKEKRIVCSRPNHRKSSRCPEPIGENDLHEAWEKSQVERSWRYNKNRCLNKSNML